MTPDTQPRIDLSQRLFIELGTSLHIETCDNKNTLSGKLVGMKVGNYLIVDISGIKSDPIILFENDTVRIKYVNLEDIFNFSTRVLTILDQPDHLVFLQYPDMVQSCNIRSHRRIDCFLPIHVQTEEHEISGVVTNISVKGCLCIIDHFNSWKNNTASPIHLLFPYGDLEQLSIAGDIMSTQMQESRIKLGIKFKEPDLFSQSVLATLVPALRV